MDEKEQSALFFQLVIGLQSSAWITLGKVMNPVTGKVEKNLTQAKVSIDSLTMLKEKTKGNLSDDEERFLSDLIQQLQLNYLDETKIPESKEETSEKKDTEKKD